MNRQKGFTLVELLVALSVSALLISLVYGVVVIGQRSVHSVGARAAESEQMRIGWQFIDAAITRAQPVNDPQDDDNPTGFVGDEQRLSFIADQPAYLGPGGLTRITLEVRDVDEHDALIIIREPFSLTPTEGNDDPPEAILVDRLSRLEIGYFGITEEDTEPAWLTRWEQQNTLPGLVKIRVTPHGAPAWPVLVARPMGGAPGARLDVPVDEEGEPLPQELLEEFDDDLLDDVVEPPLDA